MLKIGEFAKWSRVSVKTLRFYDDIGLLKPAAVDEHTGYRYYTEAQLLTVKRIAAFKEQGFTLEQIVPFLQQSLSPEDVKSKLSDKQAELRRTIREAQRQLDDIDARMARVERTEFVPPADSVIVRTVEPRLAATIRDVVPRTRLCLLLDEAASYVRSFGEEGSGPLTVIWHGRSDGTDPVDLEVAMPLAHTIPGSDRVRIGYLPEVKTAAVFLHRCDPYGSVCTAIGDSASWLASNGFVPAPGEPIRETYLTPDRDMYGPTRWAELLVPVVRA
ncbi:MerR family transcriptional regulator [Paenibacillus flagellatus]|uniref:MerR family transcriptional regulator n=1 Tax=Paenibacillus flagellatus TaxID=2211139 RepID=A0A2V5KTF7_9BACL|nr:MerR family transcriptional regulator [Paenibacillus flagellatus]PYI52486.1 MerR family transcriptional regulator [Paenibacillus flagellatus]